ncbi:hypothetical protein LPC10_25235 (plasmid) [Methylorubrum sp. B1-46]|jgi:hypothetical protein|uniref:hypothetical protein n=1 Tax=Methylorubrum sp. B1-46 TaxID=2897334 RepID=UPI0003497970|nr:hypothetical protein [Methylorubrum sp. B1-46]UGB28657.1 hypothetical protein LPC10_25235 [Methylorubrum sp. B1-46]
MTRFTMIALTLLLAVPAQAESCPSLHLYPWMDADGSCLSVQCHGERLLRAAYRRGEIQKVHLSRKSECDALQGYDPATGDTTSVPCTWDHNDLFVGR